MSAFVNNPSVLSTVQQRSSFFGGRNFSWTATPESCSQSGSLEISSKMFLNPALRRKKLDKKANQPDADARRANLSLKVGDEAKVISGADKGKVAKVTQRVGDYVVLEGVNVRTKHVRPKKEGEKGEIVKFESPIHASNVKKQLASA